MEEEAAGAAAAAAAAREKIKCPVNRRKNKRTKDEEIETHFSFAARRQDKALPLSFQRREDPSVSLFNMYLAGSILAVLGVEAAVVALRAVR